MTSSEKEVLESKDFYQSILDGIINGVWVANSDDIIYYTNKGMEKIAGIPAKQIVGSHVLKDFPESTLKYFRPYYLNAKDTLKSVFYDAVPVGTPSGRQTYQSGWLIPRIKDGKYDGIICTVDDVTERKEAKEKLKESEENLKKLNETIKSEKIKLEEIMNNTIDGISTLDLQGNVIHSNKAFANLIGYESEKQILGRNMQEFTIKDDVPKVISAMKKGFKEGVIRNLEVVGITKQGKNYYASINAKLIKDENGILQWLGVIRDVTEKKILEQKLREFNQELEQKVNERTKELKESEEKYRSLFESSIEGILTSDNEGKFASVNPAAAFILGYDDPEELIGMPATEIYIDATQREPIVKGMLEKGYIKDFEIKLKKKDGTPIDTLFNAKLHKDEKGNLLRIEAIFSDITERKLTEQKVKEYSRNLEDLVKQRTLNLKESEEKFKLIFSESPIGIELYDSNGKLLEANKACLDLFGVSDIREVEGFELFNDPNIPEIEKEMLKKGKTVTYESKFDFDNVKQLNLYKTSRSGIIYLNVIITPLYREGKQLISNYLVQIQNMTERKKLEQELGNIFTLSLNMIGSAGNDAFFKHINPAVGKTLGYTDDELLSRSFIEFIHPDDVESTLKEVKTLSEGKSTFNFVNRYRCKDGSYKWIEWNTKPIPEDEITYFVAQDVTERILTEQKLKEYSRNLADIVEQRTLNLKESEEKYKNLSSETEMILDHIPALVIYKDIENNFIRVNKYVADAHNMSKEELTGKNLFDLYPREEAQAYWDDDLEVISSGQPKLNIMEPWETEKGKRWVNTSRIPHIDEDGNVKGIIAIANDITERKKAEQKLKESEQKYKNERDNLTNILNTMGSGVYIVNSQHIIEFINPALERELGGLTGKTCYEYFLNQSEPCSNCSNMSVFEGKTLKQEFFTPKINKTFEITSTPLHNPDGSISKLGIFYDITERKKAEQKLKESEEKYKYLADELEMILDHIPALVFFKDTKNNFIRLNKYHADAHNLRKEEMQGVSCFDIYPKEQAQAYWDDDLEVVRTGKPKSNIIEPWDTPEGTRWALTSKIPYFGEKGKITGIIGLASDITERINTEHKLEESEEKFRNIAEQSLMGIAILQDDVFKYINNQFAEIFGYSVEEITNWSPKEYYKLTHPEDLSMIMEQAQKKQAGDSEVINQYQFRGIKKTGETIWVEILSKTISYEGSPADLMTIIDITEKKKAEEELKRLNKLKSELLTRASHELKTPLMSIKGFTELLLLKYKEILYEDELYLVNEIRKGCFRLETLVEDILKTAELESGTIHLEKAEEDLSLIVKMCVKELKGFADSRNQNINLMLHDKLITSLERQQISQTINNLLTNAIKFTPPKGGIEVKSEIKEDFYIISIKDSGIGFSEEEKQRIFKRFGKIERYGQGYDVVSEGSGLGLYISKKIIELHGGEIWVESDGRNKGSTFHFSLPIIKS